MVKSELIDKLRELMPEPSKKVLTDVVNNMLDLIVTTLQSGESFQTRELGIFKTRRRDARKGRNPHTGQPVAIPAKTVVQFTPSSGLKKLVNT
jgi:nucleoid DNA-binding protein